MHYRSIVRVFGVLLLVLACSMVFPLFWALFYGTGDWPAFFFSIPLVGIPGLLLCRVKGQTEIRLRDGFVIVTGGWVLSAVVGAIPYLLAGTFLNPVDALFEAMSGFTTTGATLLSNIEAQPAGILFWRSFLHWLGGMGIIVIFLAILPRLELGSYQLFRAEVPGPQVQRLKPRIRETAKILWYIYGGLSLAQTILLCLAGMSVYEALIHTFGTMATGGFSSRNLSVGAYSSPIVEAIIIAFMFAAGVNFNLYYRALFLKNPWGLVRDREFRAYACLLGVFTLLVFLNLIVVYGPADALRHSSFQVVSIMTTTGFSNADFDAWPEFSRAILFVLMFMGACAGSTGGSMKVVRLMILAKHIYREIYRMIHSSAVLPLRYGHDTIPEGTIRQVMAFTMAYLGCFAGATLAMTMMNLDLVSAATAVAATLGNVGPGLGAVGPSLNYASVPTLGRIILTFMMLLGRLEIFTVLVVLFPAFWRR